MNSSAPQPVASGNLLPAGTTTSNIAITGATNTASSNYVCVNTGTAPVWLNFSASSGPVAAFPTTKTPQPGIAVAAGASLLIGGPPCGHGKTCYVASITTTANNVYITPVA